MNILGCPKEVILPTGSNVRVIRILVFLFVSDPCIPDFQVMKPLPNVTFDLGQNWAGNVAVDRVGHPNNTLFFWAFEKENGSLTAKVDERAKEPWGICSTEGACFS
jgi:hypothetical protein